MTTPIVNPEVPYDEEIPGGLQAGKLLRLQGVTLPDADRFNINLQTGPSVKPRDDTALHISVRLNQGYIARNSYKFGNWEVEQGDGQLPIGKCQSWEILILITEMDYKIAVNGQHFCEFSHRISFNDVTHLVIDGDIAMTLISWEGIVGDERNESASKASQLNSEGSQTLPSAPTGNFGPTGGYSGEGYGAPVGGYGPPPGNYAPPPGNYGYEVPQPPGAQRESGFDSFLGQAQDVLVGAIKSGAAEKLLGSFFSSGQTQQQQGYAHQNAQYGQYPHPQSSSQGQGPVESLLSSFLGGGGQTHQQQPQFGGGDSIGGLGSMSGLLQNFAGQILQPKDPNHRQNF